MFVVIVAVLVSSDSIFHTQVCMFQNKESKHRGDGISLAFGTVSLYN